jgi:5-methylcytosine-specific restriction endonuclease McrA
MATGERQFFWDLWKTERKERICAVCGTPLYMFNPANFAHILPKSIYGNYRLNPDNIVILCFEHHYMLDNETHKAKADKRFDFIFKKYDKLREEYDN